MSNWAPEYRPATVEDAAVLAPRLRQADATEIAAVTDASPTDVLAASVRASSLSVAASCGGKLRALFGVVPVSLAGGDGRIWLVASGDAGDWSRLWLTDAREWLTMLGAGYRRLCNHVDARNDASIRWLRHMGFAVGPAVPFGLRGQLFHPFERWV